MLIAVIVPAHNEAGLITDCVRSVQRAAQAAPLDREPVSIWVVADACSDATAAQARRQGAQIIELNARNVGKARAAGAQAAIQAGARWLAFTDADTCVAPDWLAAQLALQTPVVCGTVKVRDWQGYSLSLQRRHQAHYQNQEGHRHIHGANLGVSVQAYQQVGGFKPLRSHEDVTLVRDLERAGIAIAWSAKPQVFTSARRSFKAPDGFGALLQRWEQQALALPS